MNPIISIENLQKTYDNGFRALSDINLCINQGEIFALLGPNGAGKTTLISIICGITNMSSGSVKIADYDVIEHFRHTRSLIGLVPQELTTDAFETVWNTVAFSRGLFGKPKNKELITEILKKLSLWDKKNSPLRTLSGGMRRRVMIAKALSHEPRVLFLDEPTAGVDVELRKDMWEQVRKLKSLGVTIILTTHYIEEAELMADRVGIINKGKIIVVEEKNCLMKKLGKKELTIELSEPLSKLPEVLTPYNLSTNGGTHLTYTYDSHEDDNGIYALLGHLKQTGLTFRDIHTSQSSLEEIFVELVRKNE